MTGTFQATRYHDICCGHRVVGHEGKCRNLHGHNYRVHFTVEAVVPQPATANLRPGEFVLPKPEKQLDEVGRVTDFSVIKKLGVWLEVNWDHKMLIWDQDHAMAELPYLDEGTVLVPFNPTAENIAQYLVDVVGPLELPENVRLVKVVIEETRKCSASYEVLR